MTDWMEPLLWLAAAALLAVSHAACYLAGRCARSHRQVMRERAYRRLRLEVESLRALVDAHAEPDSKLARVLEMYEVFGDGVFEDEDASDCGNYHPRRVG